MDLSTMFPRLACQQTLSGDKIVLARDAEEFDVSIPNGSISDLGSMLSALDGNSSAEEIKRRLPGALAGTFDNVLKALDRHALLDDESRPSVRPAYDVLLELEDLTNKLLYETIYQNVFWRRLSSKELDFPVSVLHGLAIENYHFLFRESFFDSPVLGNQLSAAVRSLMNEFYVDEYGHDELILTGLNSLGISREDLADTMPLPGTMALCNSLCFWAASDPLFFFSTLGLLEGKDLKKDSYIDACERFGLPEAFVKPIRQHAMINLKGEHGNLTRCIFRNLPPLDARTIQHMRRQTVLFVDIYDQFFTGVWNHYSTCGGELLRRVSRV